MNPIVTILGLAALATFVLVSLIIGSTYVKGRYERNNPFAVSADGESSISQSDITVEQAIEELQKPAPVDVDQCTYCGGSIKATGICPDCELTPKQELLRNTRGCPA